MFFQGFHKLSEKVCQKIVHFLHHYQLINVQNVLAPKKNHNLWALQGPHFQLIQDVDVSSADGAIKALAAVDNALTTINFQRANLGAIQNRFESTISNQAITAENFETANSRIRDADFAAETAELSRTQVLQSAGLSILAQANSQPQQVLQLLQG